MNKLSKEKRKRLVLVMLVSLMMMGGLWFGLINSQKQTMQDIATRKAAAEKNLKQIKHTVENADKVEADLADTQVKLAKLEEGMASGDLYFWAINTIRQFKVAY